MHRLWRRDTAHVLLILYYLHYCPGFSSFQQFDDQLAETWTYLNSSQTLLKRILKSPSFMLYDEFKPIKKISLVSKHSIVVGTDPAKRVCDFEISRFTRFLSQPYAVGFLPLHGLAFRALKKGLHQPWILQYRAERNQQSSLPSAACLLTWLVG